MRAFAIAAVGTAVVVLSLCACSTATPVVVESGRLPALAGRVNTTAGYTGEITTDNKSCRGSFTGVIGQAVVPVEITCQDGRAGIGTATIADGRFVSADVLLRDGGRLRIRPNGPSFP